MREIGRSGCPINLTLEILGDRWSLIVLRDIMFGNRRHFRELLAKSDEGIASNILADRLKRLVERGLLSRRDDATHKQKAIYSLTEMGIALVPVFAAMGDWGRRFLPVTEELSIRAEILAEGGPDLWERFMRELRHLHRDGLERSERGNRRIGDLSGRCRLRCGLHLRAGLARLMATAEHGLSADRARGDRRHGGRHAPGKQAGSETERERGVTGPHAATRSRTVRNSIFLS